MSGNFEVTGLFYEECGYKMRKYLDIQRKGSAKSEPDLMVVMMNPGSSFPLDGNDNNTVSSRAEPDNTQQQIIRVMDATSFEYARILNLSDLRTPDSSQLYKFVGSKESSEVDHSIFSPTRKTDLTRLFLKNSLVVFGWGVNPALIPLAKQAMESLNIDRPIGMLKPKTEYSYYHPLPRIYAKQQEWVKYVTSQITRTHTSCAGV